MKGEATNVGHKIRACLATVEAKMNELKPKQSSEIAIREYLAKYPTATIKAEDNIKSIETENKVVAEDPRGDDNR